MTLPAVDAADPAVWAAVCEPLPPCPASPALDPPDRPVDDDVEDDDEVEDDEVEDDEVEDDEVEDDEVEDDEVEDDEVEDDEVPLPPAVEFPAAAPDEDTPPVVLDDSAADDTPLAAPLPVPADSSEPPECVLAKEEFESEWVVSAWATPAPASTAAPTPTPRAPAVNQLDTGNTRPPRPAVNLLW